MHPPDFFRTVSLCSTPLLKAGDADLAGFYGVATNRLNEQVKRNANRFPGDFMLQLAKEEKSEVVANCDHLENLEYSKSLLMLLESMVLLWPPVCRARMEPLFRCRVHLSAIWLRQEFPVQRNKSSSFRFITPPKKGSFPLKWLRSFGGSKTQPAGFSELFLFPCPGISV